MQFEVDVELRITKVRTYIVEAKDVTEAQDKAIEAGKDDEWHEDEPNCHSFVTTWVTELPDAA